MIVKQYDTCTYPINEAIIAASAEITTEIGKTINPGAFMKDPMACASRKVHLKEKLEAFKLVNYIFVLGILSL